MEALSPLSPLPVSRLEGPSPSPCSRFFIPKKVLGVFGPVTMGICQHGFSTRLPARSLPDRYSGEALPRSSSKDHSFIWSEAKRHRYVLACSVKIGG